MHKSLVDWLTLDGYEEHAFAANIVGGSGRIWEVCKSIILYTNIDSLKSVSDFQLSPEKEFALENGGRGLVNVGDTADFHWLVSVKVKALEFRFFDDLEVDYYSILKDYKSTLSHDVYWRMFQHYMISALSSISGLNGRIFYLQSLAKAHFELGTKSSQTGSQLDVANEAKQILDDENEIWLEQLVNSKSCDYDVIAEPMNLSFESFFVSSPDNKLLVCADRDFIRVLKLPCLSFLFGLKVDRVKFLTLSPDSSYFLYNSIKSCVCIAKQKEVRFIPEGPESIYSCSFSSCGSKLVTAGYQFVNVWNVKERKLLKTADHCSLSCVFSSCNSYILIRHNSDYRKLWVWDSRTLKELPAQNICFGRCLKHHDDFQILSVFINDDDFLHGTLRFYHFHLPNDQIVMLVPRERTLEQSFTWKNKPCLISFFHSTLEIYDIKNQEVIDRIQINCLGSSPRIHCVSKLDRLSFVFTANKKCVVNLSLGTPEESSLPSHVT